MLIRLFKLKPDSKSRFFIIFLVITVFMKSHLDFSKQFHVLTIYECKKHLKHVWIKRNKQNVGFCQKKNRIFFNSHAHKFNS